MAKEVMALEWELTTVALLNGHVKLLFEYYVYTHLLVLLSALVKRVSFCSRKQSMETHNCLRS